MERPNKKLDKARAGKGRDRSCPACGTITDGEECWNCVPAEGASDEKKA